jgi:ferric-chelate reductase
MSIEPDQYVGRVLGCNCDTKLTPCTCMEPSASSHNRNANASSSGSSSGGVDAEKKATRLTTLQKVRQEGVQITIGRCDVMQVLTAAVENTEGESGVAVCGPLELNVEVRRSVASLSDKIGAHKRGRRAQGIHLHAEGYSFYGVYTRMCFICIHYDCYDIR